LDEIIEAIRSVNEQVPLPLDLPTDDELVEIEEQLFVGLGADFKEFLLTVSDVIYGTLEPVTASDPNSHTFLPEVAATAWDRGLSRELLPLCESGGGYYCINEEGLVSFWQEDSTSEETWDSVWDWAEKVWMES